MRPRKLRIILAAVLLLVVTAAALVWSYNDLYDQFRKKNFELRRTTGYSAGTPLEEINFNLFEKFMPNMVPAGFSPEAVKLRLPCDVRYYTHQEDAEPALTLKRVRRSTHFRSRKA